MSAALSFIVRRPKQRGDVVFIAIPTAGTVENGAIKEVVLADLARLHEQYPDTAFVCPMVQDYQLLRHMNVDATYDVWGERCEALIAVCDEVWVLMYKGWERPTVRPDEQYNTSVGVAGEIKYALHNNTKVVFVQPASAEG